MRVWSHDSHIEWHCANAVQAAHRALTDRSEKCMRPHVVALIAALAFSALQARAQQADCGVPAKLDDGWTIAKPEDSGLDGTRLCAIAERLKVTNANVHGVVIVRSGKLVFEQYFAGYDEPWGGSSGRYDFDANTLHDLRSVTKSIISLLFGIALDRNSIASLDEPVTKYFPEYAEVKTLGWDKITLRHLLTMASGLQWDENLPWNDKNDEWHLVNDPDPLRYVFQKPFAFAPDTFFTYNGGGTDLLGKVIEKASGVRIDALCERGPVSTARHHRLAVEGISQRQTSNGSRPAPAPA
jgi:CubicO group peptidase (beta-lactamase class C family)